MDVSPPRSQFNLPNALTCSRIAAAPLLACSVMLEPFGAPAWLAVAILVFAALTDLADGSIARAWDQVSVLGAILDPIADKMLVVTALFLLAVEGTLSGPALWPTLIIVWRELLISGIREYWRYEGIGVPVTLLAKFKTVVQFSAAFFLFSARVPLPMTKTLMETGIIALWFAAVLTLYSGLDYLYQAWRQSWKSL